MKFTCKTLDRAGKSAIESIEATDSHEAAEILRKRGVFVTDVIAGEAACVKADHPTSPRRTSRGRVKEVASFMRQMSVLVGTGTPLAEAVGAIERQLPEGTFRSVINDVRTSVEEGAQLSESLAKHPGYFDGVSIGLVSAGESGGKMDEMLARLAEMLRRQVKTREMIAGAMVYPIVLLTLTLTVFGAMLGFVLPRFEGLFQALGTPLPATTRVLMDLSLFVRSNWIACLVGVTLSVVGARMFLRSSTGGRMVASAALSLPTVGMLIRNVLSARIARIMGVLLTGRVAMNESLKLIRPAAGNHEYVKLLESAEEIVVRGENLSRAFENERLIAPALREAVRSGERAGRIGPVLLQVADALDEENEIRLKTVTSLVEPAILLFMGVVVGVVAVSMFLPLFDLAGSGGGPTP